MTGETAAPALPEPGTIRDLGTLTIDGLEILHSAVYGDVMARLDELDGARMRFLWSPSWRRGLRLARARQADLTMIGAELLERWDSGKL